MVNELAIYMVTHSEKCDNVLYEDYIIPIQAGKVLTNKRIEKVTDDIGDNISKKNKTYCELTVLYWIWKNTQEKFIGLYHYRRQFDISKNNILNILSNEDIILPKKKLFRISLEEQYIKEHGENDWNILLNTLKEIYPEYYKFSDKVFLKNKIYRFNMFIMKKDALNEYCEWLFPLLKAIEKKINITNRDEYQKRYAGFMAERLFTLYVIYNKFRIYETEVIFSGKRINENIKNIINNCIFKCKVLKRR